MVVSGKGKEMLKWKVSTLFQDFFFFSGLSLMLGDHLFAFRSAVTFPKPATNIPIMPVYKTHFPDFPCFLFH